MTCIVCRRKMDGRSNPVWLFDEVFRTEGRAHAGCGHKGRPWQRVIAGHQPEERARLTSYLYSNPAKKDAAQRARYLALADEMEPTTDLSPDAQCLLNWWIYGPLRITEESAGAVLDELADLVERYRREVLEPLAA